MNPLNRKMFRQPGMSRQPMGILASSPELANVVRSRMGQPVQMANGGQNVTNYMSAIRDLAAKGDKATLNNIARDQRLPRSVQMAAANALTGRTVPGQVPTVSDAERMAANRANLGALRGRVGQDALTDQAMAQINAANRPSTPPVTFAERGIQGPPNIDAMGNVNTSTDDAMQAAMQANVDTSGPSLIDRGIASAGNVMDMIRNAIPDAKGYASSPAAAKSQFTKSFLGPALQTTPQELSASLQDDPDMNVIRDQIEIASSSLPDDDLMVSEQLAAGKKSTDDGSGAKTTDARGRQVSTVNPETTTTSAAQQNISDNVANIKGDIFNPKDQKKLTDAQATNPDVLSTFAYEAADFVDPDTVNLENIDKAAKDIMGFDPKAAGKKKEEAFWMGLMKAGLAIAAGGSDNAMTNIAKGLSYGLDSYSKDIATLNEQERADMKEFRQLKTQMIRDERAYNLSIAGAKNTHAQHQATIKNQFERDKIDLGFKQADMLMKQRKEAASNALAFAQLQNQAAFQIAKLQQGDQQLDLNREKLAAQLEKAKPDIVKIYQGFGYLDDDGKATDKGIEAYGTELGLLNAMTTSSSKLKTTDTQRSTNALTKVLQGSNDAEDIAAAAESSLFKEVANLMQTEDVNEVIQQLRNTLPRSQSSPSTSTNTTIPTTIPTTGDPLNLAG